MAERKYRIGFISTRLSGTDGVSLETVKWVKLLTGLGHACFFFAGESEWPEEHSYLVPEAHFDHPVIRRLNLPCTLVISHAPGDEGTEYEKHLKVYSRLMNVRTIFAARFIEDRRREKPEGQKIYSLADIYRQADLVTYPSTVEGFGNAFLESIYYRRPLVISNYEIFKVDIQPKGFKVISFDDFISQDTVDHARTVLQNPDLVEEMTERNYELGRRYYSYRTLKKRLVALISEALGD